MSKFFLRWIDSWSDSENAQVGASSEYVIEKEHSMVKNYSFYFITYRLFSSVLGGRILVRGCFHAGFYFLRMFAITAFFTAIFRIKLFRHHVLFNSFLY